jgi:NADH-quinone oxidoreductase subunit J
MPSFFFYILALIAVLSSLVMITRRNPLPAAFALVLTFLCLAGLYAMLGAPLLAVLQVLVYAGAIMALVVFVIMLLNVRDEDLPPEPNMPFQTGLALVVSLPVFLIISQAIRGSTSATEGLGPDVPVDFGGIAMVGKDLFLRYGFPFEVISLLLTVSVVGVVVLAKRRI